MKLLITPFADQPRARFRVATPRRVHLSRIALHVYGHNVDDGDEYLFELIQDRGRKTVESLSMTGAQVKAALEVTKAFFHAKLFLDFSGKNIQLAKGRYRVQVNQTAGLAGDSFLAWCRDWERPYGNFIKAPTEIWNAPNYLRVYDRQGREL